MVAMKNDDRTDPSHLTTQAILREIANLEEKTNQRMDAIDRAVQVAHENLVRVPTEVDKAVGHLRELTDEKLKTRDEKFSTVMEKFASVQTQFAERDVRTEQTAKDSKVAVDAALQAAKEAVGKQQEASDRAIAKSEAATTKQMDAIGQLIAQNNAALDGKINDLKERMALAMGQGSGAKENNDRLVTVISLVIGAVGVGAAIISRLT